MSRTFSFVDRVGGAELFAVFQGRGDGEVAVPGSLVPGAGVLPVRVARIRLEAVTVLGGVRGAPCGAVLLLRRLL